MARRRDELEDTFMYAVKEIYYTLQGEGAQTGRAAVFCRFAGCNLWSGREEDRAAAVCRFCDTDFRDTDGEGGGRFATAEELAEAIGEKWSHRGFPGPQGHGLGADSPETRNSGFPGLRSETWGTQGQGLDVDPSEPGGGGFPGPQMRGISTPANAGRSPGTPGTGGTQGSEFGRRFVVCTGGEPLLQLEAALIDALHEHGFEIAIETNGTIEAPPGIDWICVSPKAGAELRQRRGDELKLVYPQEGAEPAAFERLEFRHFFLQPMDGPDREANTQAAMRYCLEHPRWRLSLQTHKLLGIP